MTVSGTPVRIVVADDHQVVRDGFAGLLATQPDFTVVGTACDGADAVRLCRELRPDVVLMDVRMPGTDGIDATRQLARCGADSPRILILTTFDLDQYVYDALRAGASGFLLKDVTAERLFDAVRVIAAGEALLAPAVTRRLISEFAQQHANTAVPPPGELAALTPRRNTGTPARRRRPVQPGDSRPPRRHRRDREDPRQPRTRQAQAARPNPNRRHRLRNRIGDPAIP